MLENKVNSCEILKLPIFVLAGRLSVILLVYYLFYRKIFIQLSNNLHMIYFIHHEFPKPS